MESNIVAVERVKEYSEVETEVSKSMWSDFQMGE